MCIYIERDIVVHKCYMAHKCNTISPVSYIYNLYYIMGVSNYGNDQMGVSLVSLIIVKDPVDDL